MQSNSMEFNSLEYDNQNRNTLIKKLHSFEK